jgi:hypothetical protein
MSKMITFRAIHLDEQTTRFLTLLILTLLLIILLLLSDLLRTRLDNLAHILGLHLWLDLPYVFSDPPNLLHDLLLLLLIAHYIVGVVWYVLG